MEKPSPIQKKMIEAFRSGRDIVMSGPSGCGKTTSLNIGILDRIDIADKSLQAVILTPTREWAQNIQSLCAGIGKELQVKVCSFLLLCRYSSCR